MVESVRKQFAETRRRQMVIWLTLLCAIFIATATFQVWDVRLYLPTSVNTEKEQTNSVVREDIPPRLELNYNLSAFPLLVTTFRDAKTKEAFFFLTACAQKTRYDGTDFSNVQASIRKADGHGFSANVVWHRSDDSLSCQVKVLDQIQFIIICPNPSLSAFAAQLSLNLNLERVDTYSNVKLLYERSTQKKVQIRSCPGYGMKADTTARLNNWLTYHHGIGINNFRLYQRGNWPKRMPMDMETIQPWIDRNVLDIIPFLPGFGDIFGKAGSANDCHMDHMYYLECLYFSKGYAEWIVDNQQDEYLRPLKGNINNLLMQTPESTSALGYVSYDWNATVNPKSVVDVFNNPHLFRSAEPNPSIWGYLVRPESIDNYGAQNIVALGRDQPMARILDWKNEFCLEHFTWHPHPGCKKPHHDDDGNEFFLLNRSKLKSESVPLQRAETHFWYEDPIRYPVKNYGYHCYKDKTFRIKLMKT